MGLWRIAACAAACVVVVGCAAPPGSGTGTVAVSPGSSQSVVSVGSGPDPLLVREVAQAAVAPPPASIALQGLGEIPILPVGVADDGSAEIPEDASRVGWYKYGSAPADPDGTVVLMGHRDFRGGKGALYDLASVATGTVITVRDASGTDTSYRVTSNDSISKKVVPLADLFLRDGPARLVVISCGGDYVKEQGGYLDNIVVTAERL